MLVGLNTSLLILVALPSAFALQRNDTVNRHDPPVVDWRCINDIHVDTFVAEPAVVSYGSSTTLQWEVTVPPECYDLSFYLNGYEVGARGSSIVQPVVDATFSLRARYKGHEFEIAAAAVAVTLPSTLVINSDNMAELLVKALWTENITIIIEDHVQIDLSHRDGIYVAPGVTLKGGRNGRTAGARLFTSTRPELLFNINGDNIRITGLRIEGPEMGIGDGDDNSSIGIAINSNQNIEIDHNEISGWSGIGIAVRDHLERIHHDFNPETIRIHDNYIHHNQHYAKLGYGVLIGAGAYALIERNVFDWNRHAISGNGHVESGYRAYRNLILGNGGYHRWWGWPYRWDYTHQFDMHGTDNCGVFDVVSDSLWNCGDGGHDMHIVYNSFLYTAGPAFKLRGTPTRQPNGAFVIANVFAHDDLGDAVQQTGSGLYTADNITGVNGMNETASGDFDGDGRNDTFLATGQTWWYSNGGDMPWTYLNTSPLRTSQVTLGYYDNIPGCDVVANGMISSGGTGEWKPMVVAPFGRFKLERNGAVRH